MDHTETLELALRNIETQCRLIRVCLQSKGIQYQAERQETLERVTPEPVTPPGLAFGIFGTSWSSWRRRQN